mmetsp:Transcript_19581/g.35454  ORF Transcript_19581/g.35454 Transcript_19581/m.35454 type:complete len:174 (-) Transcript_19581:68-589(-)
MLAQCIISTQQQAFGRRPQCDEPLSSVSAGGGKRRSARSKTTTTSRVDDDACRIGSKYQISADSFPDPRNYFSTQGSYLMTDENGSPLQEAAVMVWDSKKAREAAREIDLLESIVPHDRKEIALKLFHDNNYQINADVLRRAMEEAPSHGLNWSPATKKVFSKTIAKGGEIIV